jgi:hypothetical protein
MPAISGLDSISAIDDTAEIPTSMGGVTYKVTPSQIVAAGGGGGGGGGDTVELAPQIERLGFYQSQRGLWKDPLVRGSGVFDSISAPTTITDNTKYNAWPIATYRSDGKILLVYTRADTHVADNSGVVVGRIGVIAADGESVTWGLEFEIYSLTGRYASAFGVTRLSSGRLLVTWWVVDGTTPGGAAGTGRAGYSYSDDDGVAGTWVVGSNLHVASGFTQDSFCAGPALELPSGDILIPIEGSDSGDPVADRWAISVLSTDGGLTFGSPVTIASFATEGRPFYETQIALMPNGDLKALSRSEPSPYGYYRNTSTDNGLTWDTPELVVTGNVGRPTILVASSGTCMFAGRDVSSEAMRAFTTVDDFQSVQGPFTLDATMYSMMYAQPLELPTGDGRVLWLYGFQPTSSTTNCDIKSLVTVEGTLRISASTIIEIEDDYTLRTTDGGRCVYHPPSDATNRGILIPDNADVPIPVGTTIDFDVDDGAGYLTVTIDSDDLVVVETGQNTKTVRVLTDARLRKVSATRWRIAGDDLVVIATTTWNPADKGAATTLSNGDLTATFGTPAGGSDQAAVRSVTSHNSGLRQFDFVLTTGLNPLTGVALSTASMLHYPGFDANALGIEGSTGDIYLNNLVVATCGALTLGATYSCVFNFATGKIELFNAAGASLGSYTAAAFIGQTMFIMSGSGAHTGANNACTIDGSPAVLRGGSVAWDSP